MIWKNHNLKQKSGIKITLIYRMILIRLLKAWGKCVMEISPNFSTGELQDIFFACIKMYAFSKLLKYYHVLHFKVM